MRDTALGKGHLRETILGIHGTDQHLHNTKVQRWTLPDGYWRVGLLNNKKLLVLKVEQADPLCPQLNQYIHSPLI